MTGVQTCALPISSANISKIYKDRIAISGNRYDVLDGADALVIFTDEIGRASCRERV